MLNFDYVRPVASFHGAKHMNSRKVRAGESPVMHDLRHICSGIGQHAGKMRQTARTIIQQNVETINASIRSQPAFNHAAVRQWINVAAGEQQHDFATGQLRQLTAQQRGQTRRASTFDNTIFQLRQSQYRQTGDNTRPGRDHGLHPTLKCSSAAELDPGRQFGNVAIFRRQGCIPSSDNTARVYRSSSDCQSIGL